MTTLLKDAKQTKRVAWFFVIGGIVILTAGILRLRGMLYSPFIFHPTTPTVAVVGADDTATIDPQQDTDRDGLTDVDELIKYKTSPYIADTDSDGVSDGDEIKNSTNPLCPEGQTCASKDVATPGATTQQPQDLLSPLGGTNPGSIADVLGITSDTSIATDPKIIREQLKQAGIDPSLLDQLDDATVIDLYKKTVQSSGATPSQIANTSPTAGMSAQELRALLIRSGVDAKLLEKMTDAQVVQVVEETLKKK